MNLTGNTILIAAGGGIGRGVAAAQVLRRCAAMLWRTRPEKSSLQLTVISGSDKSCPIARACY